MRLVVAISGASGAVYGIRLLAELRRLKVETHLVVSAWGRTTVQVETGHAYQDVARLADACYENDDLFAPCASGSALFDAMVVCPCSMHTAAGIRLGLADSLILRAADVTIKEGRRLVLLVRESPLSSIHLENLLALSRLGARIMVPVPAFYHRPQSIADMVDNTVARLLDQLGLFLEEGQDGTRVPRWGDAQPR
ncbi:MAG: UbiX family flavin prenyltransferase [Coriobacteriaceae bacterium]|jgi:4-hydroxy-3-polyprenylbenzoate decarboxylase|nr:UbiX family flavin prenyltransferase [Coriobacteriaceae bacterium]